MRAQTWTAAVGALLAAVLFASGPDSAGSFRPDVVGDSLAALFVLAGVRFALVGIRVDSNGVTVRQLFRTTHISWDEISGFEMRPRWWLVAGPYLHVLRTHARPVPVIAASSSGLRSKNAEQVGAILATLNAALEEHQHEQ